MIVRMSMSSFYPLNRAIKPRLVLNPIKTEKDSKVLLKGFLTKFDKKKNNPNNSWLEPKVRTLGLEPKVRTSLKRKSLNQFSSEVTFFRKNHPLIFKKTNVKMKKVLTLTSSLNVKTFYLFLNFTKLQFTSYFFEKTLFQALHPFFMLTKKNLPLKKSPSLGLEPKVRTLNNQNILKEVNKQWLPLLSLFQFLKSEKQMQYSLESFVMRSYLNTFLKSFNVVATVGSNPEFVTLVKNPEVAQPTEKRFLSTFSRKVKKNSFLFQSFLSKNFFDLSNTTLLFAFEIMKKRSEFSIQSMDLRQKKSYWLSFINVFENVIFQTFRTTTSIFSLFLFSTLGSNQTDNFQLKKLQFYIYKSFLDSLIDYCCYPLISGVYRFSNSNLINVKKATRSFQFLKNSKIREFQKEKKEMFFSFLVLFCGVDIQNLQSRFEKVFLTRILQSRCLKNPGKPALTFLSQYSLTQSNLESFNSFDHLERNLKVFDFENIEIFLFDKFKKFHLDKQFNSFSQIQKLQNSLSLLSLTFKRFQFKKQTSFSQSFFSEKLRFFAYVSFKSHCFSLKLNKQFKFSNFINFPFSNLWCLTKAHSEFGFYFLKPIQRWMIKNQLTFFKIQVFPMVSSLPFLFSKKIYPKTDLSDHFTHDKLQTFRLQNQQVSDLMYWSSNPFGFFTLFSCQPMVRQYLENLKKVIKQNSSTTQILLINKLNLKILSYCYYNFFILNRKSFKNLDKEMMKLLWKWSLRRHNNKSNQWVQKKYFFNLNNTTWIFGLDSSLGFKAEFEKSKAQLIYLPYHDQIFDIFCQSFSS